MTQQIIRDIDSMIGYMKLVRKEVANGHPERVDALGILQFVDLSLGATYNKIKEHFKLTEEQ